MEEVMSKLLEQARLRVAKNYKENSVVYNGILGGQFDKGKLVQDALKEIINEGDDYSRLPEELPPETPLNAIDDE